MILIAYRHGLRVGELCALTWDQVDFAQGLLHVARLKNGPSVHPLGGEELRALRRLVLRVPGWLSAVRAWYHRARALYF